MSTLPARPTEVYRIACVDSWLVAGGRSHTLLLPACLPLTRPGQLIILSKDATHNCSFILNTISSVRGAAVALRYRLHCRHCTRLIPDIQCSHFTFQLPSTSHARPTHCYFRSSYTVNGSSFLTINLLNISFQMPGSQCR